MKQNIQILFSARDAAAALYVAPLAELAIQDPRFCVTVVAQEPAYSILRRRGIDTVFINAPIVDTPEDQGVETLLAEAANLISMKQPAAVVAGLSSPGQGGIDEALLRVAKCPTFLLQDFWGECNKFFGVCPDVFLVLDSAAAELTRQRYTAECFIIGSPRHASYHALDIHAIRAMSRAKLEIEGRAVIGWFGQALHQVPGYVEVIENWVEAVNSLSSQPVIVYKPHPRESDIQRRRTLEILSKTSSKVCFLEGWPVEDALLSCECACSIMSNCLYDGAYLNFHSDSPLLSPLSVLTSKALKSNLDSHIIFDALPYTSLGLAETIISKDKLAYSLELALSPEGIEQAWLNARRNLVSPTTAAADALAFIGDFVARKVLS